MTELARSDIGDYTIHRTGAARQRLARRYAAEWRFKMLGLAAVLSAMLALLILLSTVVGAALPAFVLTNAVLPLHLSGENVDRENLRNSNFDAIISDAIGAALPFAETRAERRAARGLISDGAGILVMEDVVDNPDLLGGTARIPLPMSDTVDLYVKGLEGQKEIVEVSGTAVPSAITGEIAVRLDAGATRRVRDDAAANLRSRAGSLTREAAQAEASAERALRQVSDLGDRVPTIEPGDRPELEADLAAAEAELARFSGEADDLRRRAAELIEEADSPDSEAELGSDSPSYLIYLNGGTLKVTGVASDGLRGEVLVPLAWVAPAAAGDWRMVRLERSESERQISDREIAYVDKLQEAGLVETRPNWIFFTRGASREPEMAGIWGAVVGSFLTLTVTLALAFPVGVAAAVYLEEFAPRNRWTTLIEVNINNLAAVPSIVFGLLGLAVFLNFFGLPRSTPLVGGMVLALMTLPIIIIASRAALKAVPPSIREAALGVGASRIQTVLHHVLPLAMPGVMTGTIIGMAHALGETAPLLMIGMVAFIVDVPGGVVEPATLLPVQIFMWADFPEQAFQQKTSAAIVVLLCFLIIMNAAAVLLRKRFEQRW
jgi:phosphate transport system permease protein